MGGSRAGHRLGRRFGVVFGCSVFWGFFCSFLPALAFPGCPRGKPGRRNPLNPGENPTPRSGLCRNRASGRRRRFPAVSRIAWGSGSRGGSTGNLPPPAAAWGERGARGSGASAAPPASPRRALCRGRARRSGSSCGGGRPLHGWRRGGGGGAAGGPAEEFGGGGGREVGAGERLSRRPGPGVEAEGKFWCRDPGGAGGFGTLRGEAVRFGSSRIAGSGVSAP